MSNQKKIIEMENEMIQKYEIEEVSKQINNLEIKGTVSHSLNMIKSLDGPIKSKDLSLLDLNHYALLEICKRIKEFKDQLEFARSSKKIYYIFCNYIWNRGEPTFEIGPDSKECYKPEFCEYYKFFLTSMRKHFTHFYTHDINTFSSGLSEFLLILKNYGIYEFPKVSMCTLEGGCNITDENILQLTVLLPNTESLLLIKEPLDGRYLSSFRNLRELFLIDVNVQAENVEELVHSLEKLRELDIRSCTTLRLTQLYSNSLEIVRVHVHTVRRILKHIFRLPMLKTLEVQYCAPRSDSGSIKRHRGDRGFFPFRFVLPTTLTYMAKQIVGITINNAAMHLPADWDNQLDTMDLCNLQKLVFNNWRHDDMFMLRHVSNKSALQTLACGNWPSISHRKLEELITSFSNLNMLEISDYNLDNTALNCIAKRLEYEGRVEPLKLWNWSKLKDTLTKEQMKQWMNQKRLNLYLKPGDSPKVRDFRRDLWGCEIDFDKSK